jgi:hypothetical protein
MTENGASLPLEAMMPESSVPNEIAPASWPADDDPPGEWPNAHLDTDGREGDDDRDEITPQPADDGWRRMFIEVRQVFEVHVDAEAYGDTEDANDDTELHEYLCDPMRLVEGEIVGVVTDPRLVATYAETGPSWVVSVKWDRPRERSTSLVLPCRDDES